MSEEFKPGDVVILKSGSPPMTINSVGDNYGTPTAWCVWFDGKKELKGHFPLTSLRAE